MNTAAKQRKLRAQRKLEVQRLREIPTEPLNLMDILIRSHHMVAPLLLAGEIQARIQNNACGPFYGYLSVHARAEPFIQKWVIEIESEEPGCVTLMALRCYPRETRISSVHWKVNDGGPVHPELVRSLLNLWMRTVCGLFYGSELPTAQTQHPLGIDEWSLDHPRLGTLRIVPNGEITRDADSAVSMLINEHRRLSDESDPWTRKS